MSGFDFRAESLADLAASVRTGAFSARELVEHALGRIDEVDGCLNAFVAVDADAALRAAAEIDERIAGGDDPGPLAGIPIGVKDLEDAKGFVTGMSSAIHAADSPADRDSVLVARLRAAGCVVIGKTNSPELGLKPQTDNPMCGVTRNPWDLDRTPGGSSGGTSAAIAAGLVPLATGSDGGGSIRIPSSATGLTGLKPSLGRVPTADPGAPSWHHLSSKGPMARRVRDIALALDVVRGPDRRDLRSLPADLEHPSWATEVDRATPPRTVAWSPTLGYATVDREIRDACERAVKRLESLGTEVVEVESVFSADPGAAIAALVSTYTRRSTEPWRDMPVWSRLDPLVVVAAELSRATISAVALVEAEDACHRFNWELADLFDRVDLLLCPTVSGVIPLCEMPTTVDDVLARFVSSGAFDMSVVAPGVDLGALFDFLRSVEPINLPLGTVDGDPVLDWTRMTQPFNMTRSPAGTVCVGFTAGGLPIGLQVVGPQHADVAVLRALAVLEDTAGFDPVAPR